MNLAHLFFSFEGRIGRARFWLGNIAIAIVSSAIEYSLGVPLVGDPPNTRLRLISFAVEAITIYPLVALAVKRLHDRDRAGVYVLPLAVAFVAILVPDLYGYYDASAPVGTVKTVVLTAIGIVTLIYFIDLGFRRGTAGPNQFGPDPVHAEAQAR